VVDFSGNGAAAGGAAILRLGDGATFTQIDATHWEVNYNGGASHDIITFANGAPSRQGTTLLHRFTELGVRSRTIPLRDRTTNSSKSAPLFAAEWWRPRTPGDHARVISPGRRAEADR
jgi:hypothetical protein